MSMDGLTERAELRRLRKEQERERRRLRDRQRRQSMSLVEREKHLARRRKNYQLRRQRAENAQLDPQIQLAASGEMLLANQQHASSLSDLSYECKDVTIIETDQVQEIECTTSQCLDIPGHELALPRRLRLSRLKHIARSLYGPGNKMAVGNSNETISNAVITGNETSNCTLFHGLCLSRVKQLARAVNYTPGKTAEKSSDHSKTKDELLPVC